MVLGVERRPGFRSDAGHTLGAQCTLELPGDHLDPFDELLGFRVRVCDRHLEVVEDG